VKRASGRETDAADMLERIERTATELFIRDGYHGVSYLAIAKELGVTHSNVHYYYRTKAALAEAVLERVAHRTVAVTGEILRDPGDTLVRKFVRMRDWMHGSYLQFNPNGKGGRPWGLLSRFSMDADALTADMKVLIRDTLGKLEADVRMAVEQALRAGELGPGSPVDGISLQILGVMHLTGQLTRYSSGFDRLDELLKWTITTLLRAYGSGTSPVEWPRPGTTALGEHLAR
jgi:AcrR family transcriptional regulator